MKHILILSFFLSACLPAVSGDAVNACNTNPDAPHCAEFKEANEKQKQVICGFAAAIGGGGAAVSGQPNYAAESCYGNSHLTDYRGCCSWHDGLAYNYCVGDGRVMCNDGTLSSTCVCGE